MLLYKMNNTLNSLTRRRRLGEDLVQVLLFLCGVVSMLITVGIGVNLQPNTIFLSFALNLMNRNFPEVIITKMVECILMNNSQTQPRGHII